MVLLWGLRLWGFLNLVPAFTAPTVFITALGLLLMAASLYKDLPFRWARLLPWVGVVAVAAALLMWGYGQMLNMPSYGTDELAFDQYAAQLWLHGVDPYLRSMAPSLNLFQESPDNFTWQLTGAPVTQLSYPSLAFMIYALFMHFGAVVQVGNWVNLGAWACGLILMVALLPARLKPLALVWLSLSVYVGDVSGGVTDALFFPLLLLAAYRWDRFGEGGWRQWVGPLALGLAMAVKQTPWFLLPFVVTGVALEARWTGIDGRFSLRRAAQYLGAVLVAFVLPNVPFIVGSPSGWVKGILTPLLLPTVPSGQGLISLTLFAGLGGGDLKLFTYAALLLVVALYLWFVAAYPRLRGWTFLLPSLFLLLPTRSLANYLTMLAPVALVAAVTIRPRADEGATTTPRSLWAARGALFLTVAAAFAALLDPAPMALTMTDVHTSGQYARVDKVTAVVSNRTTHVLHPAFTVENAGAVSAFWIELSGPAVLGPHQTATYVLAAPNAVAMPPLTAAFRVVAFTSTKETVSLAPTFVPTTWHLGLSPTALNRLVPIGVPVTVRTQILNQLNQPVRIAGIPVYLGQVIYAQRGVEQGTAIINGSLQGTPTVESLTDANGVATFTVTGTRATSDPLYLEANIVNNTYFYPYGYSQTLSLRFAP